MNPEQQMLQDISSAKRVLVIQAENMDGDSLSSALALEDLLHDKHVSLHCPVDTPKYLRYVPGWDRVTSDFDTKADLAIIVDTVSDTLLSKTLEIPGARHWLESHPVYAIDHHLTESKLPFEAPVVSRDGAVSTGDVVARIAWEAEWEMSSNAASLLYVSMVSDTLGLTTHAVSAETFRVVSRLVDAGANPATLEAARRELMKKSPEILAYKARLIERIQYHVDGALATVHVPWEEIAEYSDQFNPSILVLDEMRLVTGVEVAIAIKTYPDGKLTGKIRANLPVADQIAGYFGGGGHAYSSGFRVYDSYDQVIGEIVSATTKSLQEMSG